MSFPRNQLNEGEEIITEHHPHWSFMLPVATMGGLAVVATIILLVVVTEYAWVGAICILLVGIGGLGRYLTWRCTDFVLSTDRLIVRSGILSKQGIEIPLERIMNISFHQALWERFLGSGDLVVESAGETGHQPFTDVPNPLHLQNLIYKQMELAERRVSGTSTGFGAGSAGGTSDEISIPGQIEKLDDLRRRKIISDAEFEDKKRELLRRM